MTMSKADYLAGKADAILEEKESVWSDEINIKRFTKAKAYALLAAVHELREIKEILKLLILKE
jgi:hypothetical protein